MKREKKEKKKEYLPDLHLHSYFSESNGLQIPWFSHGDGLHGTNLLSQFFPVYPESQTHLQKRKKKIKTNKIRQEIMWEGEEEGGEQSYLLAHLNNS